MSNLRALCPAASGTPDSRWWYGCRHLESLWFANIANQLLWWSYVKACWRTIITKIMGSTITFKATAKGGSKMKDSALRDIWLACVAFVLLAVSIAIGIWELVDGAEIFSPLLISVLWATYNIIAPYLLIHYAIFGKGIFLHFMCRCVVSPVSHPASSFLYLTAHPELSNDAL